MRAPPTRASQATDASPKTTTPQGAHAPPIVRPDLLVSECLDQWPQAAQVFIHHGMACVGCPIARFDTLADVARAYELEQNHLLHALECCIQDARDDPPPSSVPPRSSC